MMDGLTKDEATWIRRTQKVLNACPSDRLGFYTIGDASISIYDRSKDAQINTLMDENRDMDFSAAVEKCNAEFLFLNFPSMVHATAG